MKKWGPLFVVFLLLVTASFLSAQVKFYATSDAEQIVAGQFFQVSFTLENARAGNFKAPSFVNFEIASGPSTSQQMSIVNGRQSMKMSYIYSLTADKIGTYKIGSASVTVNGTEYTSDPITIEVVKGKVRNQADGNVVTSDDIIVEAVLDHEDGYVGQQMVLKYNLLTTKDIRSYNFGRMPEFDGFFAQEIQGYSGGSKRVVRDGVQYVQKTIKVIMLFPQQKGTFSIDEATVDLGISDGKSSGFFFNRRLKKYRTKANGFTIQIKDLPDGAPLSFSGAVGSFTINTSVDKKTVAMDDAVTLTLQVRGVGDGKFIEAPEQPFYEEFDIYDPNLINETQQIIGDRIRYTKTYEYLMVPKKAGRISFTPEFSFYNIDSSRYETIRSLSYSVRVLESTGREAADVESQKAVLAPVYTSTTLRKKDAVFAFSTAHLAINGGLAIFCCALFYMRAQRIKEDNIDPAVKRRNRALKLAEAKLTTAKSALENDDVTEFYIQLKKGLIEYLADKANLSTSQLSKEDIRLLLEEQNLEAFMEDIISIMNKGDQAIYASIASGDEDSTYNRAIEMIGEIELEIENSAIA